MQSSQPALNSSVPVDYEANEASQMMGNTGKVIHLEYMVRKGGVPGVSTDGSCHSSEGLLRGTL